MNNKIAQTMSMIKLAFPYLFSDYSFKITYFAPEYGYRASGVAIGLEAKTFHYHLLFARETRHSPIRVDIGHNAEAFEDYNTRSYKGWDYLPSIINILSGKDFKGIDDNPVEDLILQSSHFRPYVDEINVLFEEPGYIKEWLDTQRASRKDERITVEMIKKERKRLHSLGLDSSLKIAMKNLQGE